MSAPNIRLATGLLTALLGTGLCACRGSVVEPTHVSESAALADTLEEAGIHTMGDKAVTSNAIAQLAEDLDPILLGFGPHPIPEHMPLDRPISLGRAPQDKAPYDAAGLHRQYSRYFVQAANNGFSRMINMPPAGASIVKLGDERFQVQQVQLVGLLQSSTPRVYEGVMPEVKEFHPDTRALTTHESGLLEQLQTGRDLALIAVPGSGGEHVILGALRATASCMDCHAVGEGALLGALAYRLAPLPPTPVEPATQQEDPQPQPEAPTVAVNS